MSDKVALITPSFNRAYIIGETAASIFAQTHENWEWVIVDDGSTDGTAALVERAAARAVATPEERGLAELERGLEHGKAYAVTCRALDAAGGCPHRGDVVQCCATSGRELPALPSSGGATPAAVWSTKPTKRGKPLQLL